MKGYLGLKGFLNYTSNKKGGSFFLFQIINCESKEIKKFAKKKFAQNKGKNTFERIERGRTLQKVIDNDS